MIGQLVKRGTAPERLRLVRRRQRLVRALVQRRSRAREQLREADRIDVIRRDLEPVAVTGAGQRPLAETAAKLEALLVQRVDRITGKCVRPDALDERVRRYDA